MDQVVAIILNKSGTPSLKISAPSMVHYADNDSTHITTPNVTIYRNSPEPWHVNAKQQPHWMACSKLSFLTTW